MTRNILLFLIIFSAYSFGDSLDVLTFYYPPFMGESSLSKEGLLVDLIKAAGAEENLNINIVYLPPKRAISQISSDNSLAFIGVIESFTPNTIEKLDIYPLTQLRFVTFYLKERFPKGFSFDSLKDLKDYSIGIIPGITEVVAKRNNLNVEISNNLNLVFKKIEKKRNDLGVAVDLSIQIMLNELFPEKKQLFDIYNDKSFVSANSVLIFNKYHPDYQLYSDKLKKGLNKIASNGKWLSIMEKYYGKNKVPVDSLKLIKNSANKK